MTDSVLVLKACIHQSSIGDCGAKLILAIQACGTPERSDLAVKQTIFDIRWKNISLRCKYYKFALFLLNYFQCPASLALPSVASCSSIAALVLYFHSQKRLSFSFCHELG